MSSRSLIALAFVLLLLLPLLARAQPTASLTATTNTYSPAGGNLTFTASMSYPTPTSTPSAIAWNIQLPTNWVFNSQTLPAGAGTAGAPKAGDEFLEWAFSSFPTAKLEFTFNVSYPANLTGDQTISVPFAQYRSPTTNPNVAPVVLAAIPEPSTYALIVGAIAFVGVIIARRRRAVAAPKA